MLISSRKLFLSEKPNKYWWLYSILRAIFLLLLLTVYILVPFIVRPSIALPREIPTVVADYSGYPVLIPDLENLSWSRMPNLDSSGSVIFPPEVIDSLGFDPSRSWQAGDRPENIIKLGDLESLFGLEQLSLDRILEIAVENYGLEQLKELTGIDWNHLTLDDFKTISWQTVPDLLEGIPGLRDLPLAQIKPLYDFFTTVADREQLDLIKSSFSASQVLDLNPEWGDIALGDVLDLGVYDLVSSIPGLITNPIGTLGKWGNTLISQVPGLNLLPFNLFPFSPFGGGQVAVIDLLWGSAEHCDSSLDQSWFVTGSAIDNQTIIKKCDPGKGAGYIELTDLPTVPQPLFYGKRFVSGKDQLVDGGKGILKSVGGGKEPTGRAVYGSIKVQATDINQSTGLFKTAISIPFCYKTLFQDFGCTPHIFWIPWITYSEGMLFPMGGQPVPPNLPPTHIMPPILAEKPKEPDPASEQKDTCYEGTATGQFHYPVNRDIGLTSHFGYRTNPINQSRQFHAGIDFATGFGSTVVASDGGTVSLINNSCDDWGKSAAKRECGNKGGNWVFINHANGYQTRYLHLQLGSLLVHPNQKICTGAAIAKSGNSGSSTGPHLHFEILENGIRVNPVNLLK